MDDNSITWSLVVASNSDSILNNNLLKSVNHEIPDEIIIKRNYPNICLAYNEGILESSSDVIVLAHQDVYFPNGWSKNFKQSLNALSAIDENWGVTGVFGRTESGIPIGYAYSTGLGRLVGKPFSNPHKVRTIDEMLIILRRPANLLFDTELPYFHLYATDICLNSESNGYHNYVIPCFVLHNSKGIMFLPLSFWKAYLFIRKKWANKLPIVTPCTTISNMCAPIFRYFFFACISAFFKDKKIGKPVIDPDKFLENLSL